MMWVVQIHVKNLTDDVPAKARLPTQEECGDCPLKPVRMEMRLRPLNHTFNRGRKKG